MSKRSSQSPVIPWIGGTLIWVYMSILAHTLRWKFEGIDKMRALWTGPRGWVAATWHSRILLMPVVQILWRPRWPKAPHPPALMVSTSRDGEFTKRAGTWLGLFIIRGSAPTKKEKAREKRGLSAAREAMQVMQKGGGIVVTIDGPKGPPEVVGIGAIKLAQQMNAVIMIYGLSAHGRRLQTWDRLLFPKPFARAACVIDTVETSKDMDSEVLRLEVERKLKAAITRADELAGLAPDDAIAPAPAQSAAPVSVSPPAADNDMLSPALEQTRS